MLAHNLTATGATLINGKSTKDFKEHQQITAFVQQDDILLETLTVKECLEFTAMLKYSSNPDSCKKRVQELLEELELTGAEDVRFGGIRQRGRMLSRGEKKRLSIAVELMTNPSLLFLDEPTTSMDTFTAEKIVNIILKLKQKGRTIIATIHQPNTDIYQRFDQLMVLALGKVIYQVTIQLQKNLARSQRCCSVFCRVRLCVSIQQKSSRLLYGFTKRRHLFDGQFYQQVIPRIY
eukprot:TRINITY_DN106087_c1_g1_i1.p1 TRINITY_DN106087_c1_g1~~TRINITY_DN106087_c1_g1_i1.p1  ORF type:complete len:235 (+),score=7.16 TRINITY_DN106087_c1_g1_i1:614-1318(+)